VKIISAQFTAGAAKIGQLPDAQVSELMMCGSSNAGKSTLLNRFAGRRELARVSKEPGKTREINLYRCRYEGSDRKQREFSLVDMPGFGYAKASKTDRQRMARLTVEYIVGRVQLKCVLLLVDPKRGAGEDELALLPVAARALKPLFVVATKCDRFNQREKAQYLGALAESCRMEVRDLFITGEGLPLEPILERIEPLIQLEKL
jgi:GTP-binding protein